MPGATHQPHQADDTESDLEAALLYYLRVEGLPLPEPQYYFARPRRYRADFAYVRERLLIEVEGGAWSGGRHVRGAGFQKDCAKYNLACLLGWRVLRFTGTMIHDGSMAEAVKVALGLQALEVRSRRRTARAVTVAPLPHHTTQGARHGRTPRTAGAAGTAGASAR